ncbi:retrotransposon protein, putative, ty1-copia subclass, partial [Tanacetum coccineum]
MYVIEQPIPPAPAANFAANVLAEWNAVYDAYNEVACVMLESMTSELHRQFENYSPYEMLHELNSMFEKQDGVESVGLILNGLTSDFAGFVRNYNMHNMGKTIGELHAMLIEYEKGLPKKAETPQVMAIRGGKIQKTNKKSLKAKGKGKANGKGKDKQVYIPKPKNPKPTAKEHPAKDDTCHHCKEVGHWKRNCPVYLAELLKKKKQVGTASSSDGLEASLEFPLERSRVRIGLSDYATWHHSGGDTWPANDYWYEVSRSTRGSISLVDPAGDSLEAITPDLPIEEPDNSLSMGDEHLSTIPETESDELIKSSVEILVPIPSLEEVNDDHEEKEFDLEDILQIQDVILRRNCKRDFSNTPNIRLFDWYEVSRSTRGSISLVDPAGVR